MAETEFELIQRYILPYAGERADVVLGIGDDCALLSVPPHSHLAVSIDALVAGTHFFHDTNPTALGHKALAVSLSDLAAMGATPAWATLTLTLPESDVFWLDAFMQGFSALAKRFAVQLVGGDVTRGPLAVSVQVHGFLPAGEGMRRSGARPDDVILVTGTLGDAALALQLTQQQASANADYQFLRERLDRPEPRVDFAQAIRALASAAIDLSDGLAGDLNHLCRQSDVSAVIDTAALPLSSAFRRHAEWSLAVSGGDDYELCFTLPVVHLSAAMAIADALQLQVSCIGSIKPGAGVSFVLPNGQRVDNLQAYQHFRADT
jgi:thiamine-monophosphate kinase